MRVAPCIPFAGGNLFAANGIHYYCTFVAVLP